MVEWLRLERPGSISIGCPGWRPSLSTWPRLWAWGAISRCSPAVWGGVLFQTSVDGKNSQKRTTTHTLPRGGNGRGATEELRWLDVSRSLVGSCANDLCVMENEDPAILGSQTSRL